MNPYLLLEAVELDDASVFGEDAQLIAARGATPLPLGDVAAVESKGFAAG